MRRALPALFLTGAAVFIGGNLWIEFRAHRRVFSELSDVPRNDVALVLGTSPRLTAGGENPFFAGRMRAAAELYRAQKVRRLLLSGNRSEGYDEPTAMREALAKLGVPENATAPDYAGFRTLDSFARAREVFHLSQLTIVTDDFHAARSVLLARHFSIDAVAYTSRSVPLQSSSKTRLREIAARWKALLDLYVLQTRPLVPGS